MIVVTGATGNIGRPLTQVLAEAGREVVAVSRHPAAVPDGVRHVVADLARPGELAAVLPGAEALFLLLSGNLHAQAARPADLIGEAVAAGVRRVVLLSTQGVVTRPFGATRIAPPNPPHDAARAAWLRDVRCAAEQRHFRWSIWELNGSGGMAIVEPHAPERLDRTTLDALGLDTAAASMRECHS